MGASGIVAVAVLILGYAAVSGRLAGSIVTPAMVFVGGGILAGSDVLGLLDPSLGGETVRAVAEATLTVVLFSDASRIDLAALRREYVLPLRLLAIGLPLTIVAGALAGVAVLGRALADRGGAARHRAGTDRCRAGARPSSRTLASPHASARGSTSRAGSLRRHLCAVAPDCDRGGGGGGRSSGTVPPLTACSMRSATAWSAASSPGSSAGRDRSGRRSAAARRSRVAADRAGSRAPRSPTGWRCWMGGSGFIAAFVGGAVFGGLRRDVGGEVTLLLEETGGVLGAVTFVRLRRRHARCRCSRTSAPRS